MKRKKKKSMKANFTKQLFVSRTTKFIAGLVVVAAIFGLASYYTGDQANKSQAAVQQRFPGDPNPLVSGKAYFGTSGDYVANHEAAAGKSVGIYRKFNQWNTASSAVNTINSNFAANRLVWISFKTPRWAEVANGNHDSVLDSMLRTIDATGHPVWVTFWHEPENDEGNANAGSAADYVNMQRHIRQRMNAVGTKNIAFAPVYQSSQIVSMGSAEHNNWYGSGIWDFIGFDIYQRNDTKSILDSKWTTTINWVLSKGLPYAIGEWGVRSTAPSSEITNFWNWAFDNKKDMVGMNYFDSDANSVGSWILTGANNTVFNNILKSDPRVMRVSELGSSVDTGGSGGGSGGTGGGGTATKDSVKPSVAVVSPKNGSTVKGTVTIKGIASDNVGVTGLNLRVDDKWVTNDKTAPYSFSLNTTAYDDGKHTIVLRASDKAGNSADASVSVTVDNSPTDGASTSKDKSRSGKPKETTVIDSNTPSSEQNPVEVSGTIEITPTTKNSELSVSVDGKEVDGNTVDSTSLTNGNHTLSVTENGKTKHVVINVDNPWHIAAVNEVREHPVAYGGGGAAASAALWFSHRRLFDLAGGIFKLFPFH